MQIQIRKATRADVPQVVALMLEDNLGSQRETMSETAVPPSYYAAFDAIEREPNNNVYVAELDGDIIGTFHCQVHQNTCNVLYQSYCFDNMN